MGSEPFQFHRMCKLPAVIRFSKTIFKKAASYYDHTFGRLFTSVTSTQLYS